MNFLSRRVAAWSVAACLLFTIFGIAHAASATISWKSVRSTPAIRSMATDGNAYVGAAPNGIWVSNNLTSWQRVSLPADAGNRFNDVIYDGGEFIAVGDGIVASLDGSHWVTLVVPKSGEFWNAITYHTGIYIAVGLNGHHVLRSTDGSSWQYVSTGLSYTSGTGYSLAGIASNGTVFVASAHRYSGTPLDAIITSTDGLSWSSQTVSSPHFGNVIDSFGSDVAWGSGVFVVGGTFGVYTSADGVNWTSNDLTNFITDANAPAYIFTSIRYNFGEFVAAGVDYKNNASNDALGAVFTSTDGINWTAHDIAPKGASLFSIGAAMRQATGYVAAGYLGVYSSDLSLSSWTSDFEGPQTNFSTCVVYAHGKFVIPGTDGAIASTDGATWPDTLSGSMLGGYQGKGCATYGAGVYVAVDNRGQDIKWSNDGNTWSSTTSLIPHNIVGVAWNGKEFLAIGENGILVSSTDGKAWQSAGYVYYGTTGTLFGDGAGIGGGITYEGGQWLTWGNDINGPFIFTSTDGKTWAQTSSLPTVNFAIKSVAYGDNTYIALGDDDKGVTSIYASQDGRGWYPIGSSGITTPVTWADLIWTGKEFMATGTTATGNHTAFLSSSDGTNWALDLSDSAFGGYSLAWDGTQYVAAGLYDVLQGTVQTTSSSSGSGSGTTSSKPTGSSSSSSSGGGGGVLGLFALFTLLGFAMRRRIASR